MPENTGAIQESSKFKKGHSGNPKGKPKGARNKSTLAAEALLEGSLDKICKRVEEEALNGNMQAAKMILDRFIPVRKDRVIKIDLPMINTYKDVLLAIGSVVNGVGNGTISPSEGESLSRTIDIYSKALEINQLEHRLDELERQVNLEGK
jgi:Family of unknown function (DUF5681)